MQPMTDAPGLVTTAGRFGILNPAANAMRDGRCGRYGYTRKLGDEGGRDAGRSAGHDDTGMLIWVSMLP